MAFHLISVAVLVLVTGVIARYLVRGIIRTHRKAAEAHEQVEAVLKQLERALQQIHSHDEDEILAGLQTMSVLNDPIRLEGLSRLVELAHNANPLIARQATATVEKIRNSATKSRTAPKRPGGGS